MSFNVQKIKKLIQIRKMTYKEVGELLGVSDKTVLNYLKQKTKIDSTTICKFAKLFDVSPCYFFDTDENLKLNNKSADFISSVDLKENENEGLKKQIEIYKELLKTKNTVIELLESK